MFVREDVEYYLVKRKPKKGKPSYHARIFDRALDADGRRKIKAQKSTGATNETLVTCRTWVGGARSIPGLPHQLRLALVDLPPFALKLLRVGLLEPQRAVFPRTAQLASAPEP